jgi:uncharacterized protein
MSGAQRRPLPGGRWHFQHGPIDIVIGAYGDAAALANALDAAWVRFQRVLTELVAELPLLRTNLAAAANHDMPVQRPIAQRMVAACRPYARQGLFITPMAAVAGSVAQELIAHFTRQGVRRAYVNNGGDIALHLAPGESFDIGVAIHPDAAANATSYGIEAGSPTGMRRAGIGPSAPGPPPEIDGQFQVAAASPVRGIATSGWRGRSLSLGIADSVTVLAATAAQADAAATLIANAVNIDAASIARAPANTLRDDSDLGELLATVHVPTLHARQVALALDAGARFAQDELAHGRVLAAWLCLQGQTRRIAPAGFHAWPDAASGSILKAAAQVTQPRSRAVRNQPTAIAASRSKPALPAATATGA